MTNQVVEGVVKRMSFGNEGSQKAFCRMRILDGETYKHTDVVVLGKSEVENLRERDIQTEEVVKVKGRLVGRIIADEVERVSDDE